MGDNVRTPGKTAVLVAVVLALNLLLITCAVLSGMRAGDPSLRFEENQAVTFLSALLLGLTGWSALVIHRLVDQVGQGPGRRFWLFSSLGFFYLCVDEYFMAHEGLDDLAASLLRGRSVTSEMDGLTIAVFGIVALAVCVRFRREILRERTFILFLVLGAVCLAGTVVFDLFKSLGIPGKILEESFKIVGVSFFFTGYAHTLLSLIHRIPRLPET